MAGVTRYLKEKSGGKVKCWLADPPGSVLYSYKQSGGKLTERKGSSITEGLSSRSLPRSQGQTELTGSWDGQVSGKDA